MPRTTAHAVALRTSSHPADPLLPPPLPLQEEMVVAAHKKKFEGTPIAADSNSRNPIDLAALDVELWRWQWACDSRLVGSGQMPKPVK